MIGVIKINVVPKFYVNFIELDTWILSFQWNLFYSMFKNKSSNSSNLFVCLLIQISVYPCQ